MGTQVFFFLSHCHGTHFSGIYSHNFETPIHKLITFCKPLHPVIQNKVDIFVMDFAK